MVITRSQSKKLKNDSIKGAIKTALDFLEKQKQKEKQKEEREIDINKIQNKVNKYTTHTNILYDSSTNDKTVDIKEYDTLKKQFNELRLKYVKLEFEYETLQDNYDFIKKNNRNFNTKILKKLESDSFYWRDRRYVRV